MHLPRVTDSPSLRSAGLVMETSHSHISTQCSCVRHGHEYQCSCMHVFFFVCVNVGRYQIECKSVSKCYN